MHRCLNCYIIFVTFFTKSCMTADAYKYGEEMKIEFPGSYAQEKDLADAVCAEWAVIESASTICRKNFLEQRGTFAEPPAELQIKCQSEESVTLATSAAALRQLVVLVNDENDREIINYRLIDVSGDNLTISTIYTGELDKNYTLWSAALDDRGRHSVWRRGPVIQPWVEVTQQLEKRQYDVNVEFLLDTYQNETHEIEARFSWNTSDDSCFRVQNTCNKKTQGDFFEKQIKADHAPWVVVGALPLDDGCAFEVRGLHGSRSLAYRTPACRRLPGCQPLPEILKDITINAIPDESDELWTVEVAWRRPDYDHDYYNVTLRAAGIYSVIVPGNATGVEFERVRGEGYYNASVVSVLRGRRAVAARLAVFPARTHGSEGVVIGVAWLAALLAVLAGAALAAGLLAWRKRRHLKTHGQYYAGIQDKNMKLSEADSGQELVVEDQWEVRPEWLILHEVVGEGAFGVVRRGMLAPGNKEVAVKMLKDFPSVDEIRSFRSEMELMKSVGAHPHVVSLLACCSGRRPLIVVEYCSRGDLLSYLRCAWDTMVCRRNARYYNNNKENVDYRNDFKSKESKDPPQMVVNRLYDLQGVCDTDLTMLDLLSFCRQIAMGMEFLASNRVVHRDLAARNVLVTADRTLKIADFGLSRDVYQENHYKQKGNGKMPVKWMALESLTHRVYTTQSDVWSFGVVMWEVVTLGGAPYAALGGARLPRLLRAGYRMPRPHNCDPQLYEVMLSCWHERPRSRPTFAELHVRLDALLAACAHPYLLLHAPEPERADARPHRAARARVLFRGTWGRGRSYEWPACGARRNHYTPRPASLL